MEPVIGRMPVITISTDNDLNVVLGECLTIRPQTDDPDHPIVDLDLERLAPGILGSRATGNRPRRSGLGARPQLCEISGLIDGDRRTDGLGISSRGRRQREQRPATQCDRDPAAA